MNRVAGIVCLLALLGIPFGDALGDYLEVRRSATIKADPDGDALIFERVKPGVHLRLLDNGRQSHGYYRVVAPSQGRAGWIYRTLVRRYPGEIPEPDPQEPSGPLADPTGRLTPEERGYAARHLRIGKPQAVYERIHEGYALAQDAALKIPLWVQYELRPEDLNGPAERRDDFRPDTSIPFGSRAELVDYSGSGFDRGHMAPAEAMNRSAQVMSESFLLSNMAPQVGVGFNRHLWAHLEAAIRGWVEQRGPLTVITGPVFAVEGDSVRFRVLGPNHVAVPTHFYKIVVDADSPGGVETLAFLVPNRQLSGRQYSEFLTTIDEIEAATGLNFLSALPVTAQEAAESRRAPNVW